MAEPAYNSGGLIGFDNTGTGYGNNSGGSSYPVRPNPPIEPPTPPIPPTPPTQLPTNDTNVTAVSQPPVENTNIENTTRSVEDTEGEIVPVKIANFIKNGIIRVTGRYSQNYFDFDTYDLSVINVINDDNVNFKFILCLKNGNESIPQLYATKNLYETLVASYQYGNPIGVNDIINERNIVVIDLAPLKQKVEDLRLEELALDINLTTDNEADRDFVQIIRNLFVVSNYQINESNAITAFPTYTLLELFRYISWVVSKPSNSYDNRLLPADVLGDWRGNDEEEIPSDDEPSTPINEEVDDNNDPAPPPPPLYPPIGRAGRYDEEEVFRDSVLWIWNEDDMRWEFSGAGGSGNQSGGYGGFD